MQTLNRSETKQSKNMKSVSDKLEWIDYVKGRTYIKGGVNGFVHVLAFTGERVFPCVYNKKSEIFSCGSLYIQHVKKFAYMPCIT